MPRDRRGCGGGGGRAAEHHGRRVRALPGEAREIALKPWLYRVAHNESISLLRRRRPAAELDPDRLTDPAADAEPPRATGCASSSATWTAARPPARRAGDARAQRPQLRGDRRQLRVLDGGGATGVDETRVALHEMAEGREMECERVAPRSRRATSACSAADGCAPTCANATAARLQGGDTLSPRRFRPDRAASARGIGRGIASGGSAAARRRRR